MRQQILRILQEVNKEICEGGKVKTWGIPGFYDFLSRTDPKPILLKGLCKTATEEDFIFDTEFYPSGRQDGRIYFRFQSLHLTNISSSNLPNLLHALNVENLLSYVHVSRFIHLASWLYVCTECLITELSSNEWISNMPLMLYPSGECVHRTCTTRLERESLRRAGRETGGSSHSRLTS